MANISQPTAQFAEEKQVANMMAHAADFDLGKPWEKVQVAMAHVEVAYPGATVVFMQALFSELIESGYDPSYD